MADEPTTQEAAPDLASLLKSLAGYTRQQQDQVQLSAQQVSEATPYINQPGQSHEVGQENHPAIIPQQPYSMLPQQFPQQPQQYSQQQQYPVPQNQYGYSAQSVQSFGPSQQFSYQNQAISEPNRKVVDPATIIDWPSGLKCVMKTVARHDQMIHEIRRMIKTQHEHEEQWWNGRQALIEKQKNRKEGREKLAAVLRSVGSTAPEDNASDSEIAAEEADELRTFDTKVYKAQFQMVKEMSTKLKSMGIPFFGTRSELVRVAGRDDGTGNKAEVAGLNLDGASEVKKGDGRKIDEEDLINLQRKMLGILEDLCEG